MSNKIGVVIIVLCLIMAMLIGCAPMQRDSEVIENLAGFWLGLWHGLILPITFIVSLFNKSVAIYEVFNGGGWYDFGFILGVGISWSSGAKATNLTKRG